MNSKIRTIVRTGALATAAAALVTAGLAEFGAAPAEAYEGAITADRSADGGGPPSGASAFGRAGTVVDSFTETDLATGVVSTRSRTEDYDSRGRLVHVLELETVGDSAVWRLESTHEYLAGRDEQIVTVADQDGDGPEPADVIVTDLVYDNRGLLVAVDTTYDFGADGTIDASDHETFTQDQRGRDVAIHAELGEEGLVIDITLTYDKHGNVTSSVEDIDELATPQSPDLRLTNTSEYDGRGNFLTAVDESYVFAEDGTSTLADRFVFTSTYGKAGVRISDHSTADFDGDGVIDGVQDTVYGYEKGRQTSSVATTVEGGETTVETVLESSDNRGNLLTFLREIEVDGELVFRGTETNTFDTSGRFTSFVLTHDEDGDGQVDVVERQVVTSHDGRGRVTGFVTTEEDGAGTVLVRHEVAIEWFKDYQIRTSFHDDDNDGDFDRKIVIVRPLGF
jgi:hypothetical protein